MLYKLAIDFGTTNSVVACWNEQTGEADIITISGLSQTDLNNYPPLIPSLLYLHQNQPPHITVGQTVRDNGLDRQKDNRLFRNFKRGIVTSPSPPPRRIDGKTWQDQEIGQLFLAELVANLPYQTKEIEQLVLTAPVSSFENYLVWLAQTLGDWGGDKIRIVDESTAAALGYAVTEPNAIVLVFDFGGGTLDLSMVQLPASREKTGGFLNRLLNLKTKAKQHSAKVIAKAGQIIGGSDIDQWLLSYVLLRLDISPKMVGDNYTILLTLCEQAKINLSTHNKTTLTFNLDDKTYNITLTRTELEIILEEKGFFTAIRRVVDKVMYVARQRGIYREDINYVLLVGGTSLMPAVQHTLQDYFSEMAVRADKPFTAIAEGALQVALGAGLEDYLAHSYSLRHLNLKTNTHAYDEIIPMGTAYPTTEPIEVILGAAYANQKAIEFVIGEVDSDAVAMIELQYHNDQPVFVAQADKNEQQIALLNLNEAGDALALLVPPGEKTKDRLKALFSIDENRQLRLTVIDLQTNQEILKDVAVISLR